MPHSSLLRKLLLHDKQFRHARVHILIVPSRELSNQAQSNCFSYPTSLWPKRKGVKLGPTDIQTSTSLHLIAAMASVSSSPHSFTANENIIPNSSTDPFWHSTPRTTPLGLELLMSVQQVSFFPHVRANNSSEFNEHGRRHFQPVPPVTPTSQAALTLHCLQKMHSKRPELIRSKLVPQAPNRTQTHRTTKISSPNAATRRPQCTHTTMNRLHGEHTCNFCGKVPSLGWVYSCE